MSCLALTEDAVLHGAIEFQQACSRRGVRPVHGLTVSWEEDTASSPPSQLLLHAATPTGLQNLVQLSTQMHRQPPDRSPSPLNWQQISAHAAGLLVLEGGPDSATGRALLSGDGAGARRGLDRFLETFGRDSVALEIQDDGRGEQGELATRLLEFSAQAKLPAIATWDVRGLRAADLDLWPRSRWKEQPSHLGESEEIQNRFARHPHAVLAAHEWASRCDAAFEVGGPLHFAHYDPTFSRYDAVTTLEDWAVRGLRARLDGARASPLCQQQSMDRLKTEIELVTRAGYVNLFLVMADLARFAGESGIAIGPGRGAIVSSLLAYALGISDVDPVKYGLFFETFMNPAEPYVPEISVDVCPDRRHELLAYLRSKYGPNHLAHLAAFTTPGLRQACRAAARALDVGEDKAARAWSRLSAESPRGFADASASQIAGAADVTFDQAARWKLAASMRSSLPHAAVLHPSGMIMDHQPLETRLPMMTGHDGHPVCQWDAASIVPCSYIKLDLLGLRAVSAGVLAQPPVPGRKRANGAGGGRAEPTDQEIMRVFQSGDTAGIFQFESTALRSLLKVSKVSCFEDLASLIALNRPSAAPLLAAFQSGTCPASAVLPQKSLRCLESTRGVMLYEEQMIEVTMDMTGWSPGAADELRRLFLSRDAGRIHRRASAFVKDARRRHLRAPKAESACAWLQEQAPLVFSRAQAVAHAALAWRMACLKICSPARFYATVWPAATAHERRPMELYREACSRGVRFLPPDINQSRYGFTVEDGAVRWGLGAIRHITEDFAREWERERECGGPCQGVEDFCWRMSLQCSRSNMEPLVAAGAFDFTGISRPQLKQRAAQGIQTAAVRRKDNRQGQMSLFDSAAGSGRVARTTTVAEKADDEIKRAEMDALGVVLSDASGNA